MDYSKGRPNAIGRRGKVVFRGHVRRGFRSKQFSSQFATPGRAFISGRIPETARTDTNAFSIFDVQKVDRSTLVEGGGLKSRLSKTTH